MIRGRAVVVFLMLVAAGCATLPGERNGTGLDHIIVGAPSLEAGIAAFEKATGVTPQRGGRHPMRATENALVSLGERRYLEIVAPQADAGTDDPFVVEMRRLPAPSLVGWAVHVGDAGAASAKIAKEGFGVSPPRPGSRVTPSGEKLEWVSFGVTEPQIATAPFFIEWGKATRHPSLSAPRCTLVSFRLDDPRAKDLSRLLDAAGARASVRQADRPHLHLEIRCGERTARFDSE
jgi:hypothetical protein